MLASWPKDNLPHKFKPMTSNVLKREGFNGEKMVLKSRSNPPIPLQFVILRHASVSSTYPDQSVRKSVRHIFLDLHSDLTNRRDDIAMADMVADMVADMDVDMVDDMVADMVAAMVAEMVAKKFHNFCQMF